MAAVLLFLDIDGPLIPFGGAAPYPVFDDGPGGSGDVGDEPGAANPLLGRIDPSLGPRLVALHCELVWASTWLDDANAVVAPRLGFPPLPLVDWPDPAEDTGTDTPAGLHWKTRPLLARAAGRPFVWVDDEITDVDRAWVSARHPEPACLYRVDHRTGLRDPDFVALRRWLARAVGVPGDR
ncbi:hypothetical protein ACIQU5_09690 [Streptomyces sp. NPDC090306]|uniref:hypothetical protein n=1 Tax=Streptomyces sp. NPDC090306 TaxID=3365961 RepID=UPI0037FE21A1